MRSWPALVFTVLTACASAPQRTQSPEFLLADDLFGAPSVAINAADVFALSDPMKRYLTDEINSQIRAKGAQRGLLSALYQRDQLKLQYDPSMTRNAAQAFDARAGNCLSLVIMTAAFAKELGLPVRYQSAYLEETWSRSGDLLVRSGHVNVTLERRLVDFSSRIGSEPLTVDFLPARDVRGLRSQDVSEGTIVAMYMNNKAAEALADGFLDDAYAWTREAIRQNPDFMSSYNTLGVIYMRRGHLVESASAFNHLLERQPDNGRSLANLARVYARQGRHAESAAVQRRLAQVEPIEPFYYLNLGLAAMEQQNFELARNMFAKEVARADYNAQSHFWLAVANFKLGEIESARLHLGRAVETSVTPNEQNLYAAKLSSLQQHGKQSEN